MAVITIRVISKAGNGTLLTSGRFQDVEEGVPTLYRTDRHKTDSKVPLEEQGKAPATVNLPNANAYRRFDSIYIIYIQPHSFKTYFFKILYKTLFFFKTGSLIYT